MDAPQFYPETSVAETLKHGRQISSVFIKLKTACVGCYLTQFCTLEDVAKSYDLSLEKFLDELERALQTNQTNLTGDKDEKFI